MPDKNLFELVCQNTGCWPWKKKINWKAGQRNVSHCNSMALFVASWRSWIYRLTCGRVWKQLDSKRMVFHLLTILSSKSCRGGAAEMGSISKRHSGYHWDQKRSHFWPSGRTFRTLRRTGIASEKGPELASRLEHQGSWCNCLVCRDPHTCLWNSCEPPSVEYFCCKTGTRNPKTTAWGQEKN